MKWLLTIFTLLVTSTVFGQGFTYSYVDPCSKKLKTIYLNSNESVTVNYLGVVGTFTQADFQNGVFSSWVQSAQTQAASQPCDELKTQTQTNQNIFITQNIISTLTSITAASTMNIASGNMMSNALGNSTSSSSESQGSSPRSRKNSERNGNKEGSAGNQTNSAPSSTGGAGAGQSGTNSNPQNQNTGTGGENQSQGGVGSNTNPAPQTGGQSSQPSVTPGSSSTGNSVQSSSTPSTGSGSSGSSNGSSGGSSSGGDNSGSSGNNSGGNNGGQGQQGSGSNGASQGQTQGQSVQEGQTPPKTSSDQGQSGNGGTTNSVANAAEASSSSGSGPSSGGSKVRVGSIVGTGDIVAIRSAEDNSNQFRGTMSVTKSNTNNTKAKGFLLNFTTSINNSNLTFYTAFSNKAKTNTLILANSSMLDFEANFFNTTTVLESRRLGKLTVMAGANFTAGKMANESFNNLSGVGGGFYPFKLGKKISGSTLLLAVYSPYTKFYEGKWWDSGILLVPFSSWDYTISKTFKYNVSFSGTYQVKGSVLNYQILTGGKILL